MAISNIQTNNKLKRLQTALRDLKPIIGEFSRAVDASQKSVSEMKIAGAQIAEDMKRVQSETSSIPREPTPVRNPATQATFSSQRPKIEPANQ